MNKWLISRNIISVFCVFNHFHANDVHECDFENRHFNVRGFYAFVLVYFTYNIQTITLSVVSLTCVASASRLLVYALEIFSLTDSLAYLLINYVSVAVRNTAIINRYFYTCSCVFACWLKRVETARVVYLLLLMCFRLPHYRTQYQWFTYWKDLTRGCADHFSTKEFDKWPSAAVVVLNSCLL